MTKQQFDEMTLDELIEWGYENLDDITTEDLLLEFAKCKIDDENLYMAIHVLTAVYNSEYAYHGYYLYDYNMGTLEMPTPITCKEDLEHLIDFDDEEEIEIDTLYHDCSEEELRRMGCFGEEEDSWAHDDRSEMPWDYGRHFDDEDEEDPQDHDNEANWETQLRCR